MVPGHVKSACDWTHCLRRKKAFSAMGIVGHDYMSTAFTSAGQHIASLSALPRCLDEMTLL